MPVLAHRTISTKFRTTLALKALLLSGTAICMQAHAQLPPMQHQGSVDYVCGGIGKTESDAFKAAMSDYPLALTFASQVGGRAGYVADVRLVISGSNADVLNITAPGPYCLVTLPAGHYDIKATYNGQQKSRDVSVQASGTRQAMFEWK